MQESALLKYTTWVKSLAMHTVWSSKVPKSAMSSSPITASIMAATSITTAANRCDPLVDWWTLLYSLVDLKVWSYFDVIIFTNSARKKWECRVVSKARLTSKKLFLSTFLSTLQNQHQLDKNFPVLYLPTIVTCWAWICPCVNSPSSKRPTAKLALCLKWSHGKNLNGWESMQWGKKNKEITSLYFTKLISSSSKVPQHCLPYSYVTSG